MNWLGEIVQNYVGPEDTLLDLGCGIMGATAGISAKSVLGVDIFPTYLTHIRTRYPTVILGMEETGRFVDQSYDVVICLDVVEHLEKELAIRVLGECPRICRKSALIFTPKVLHDNEQPEGGAWGMGENEYQKHRCLITADELTANGYSVVEHGEGLLGIFNK